MALHCRKSSEPHLPEIARKSNQCQKRQLAESIVFVADHNDPAGHRNVGDHAAKCPKPQVRRSRSVSLCMASQIHQNRHRRVFFSRHHSSPRKSLTIFSFCPPERSFTISPSRMNSILVQIRIINSISCVMIKAPCLASQGFVSRCQPLPCFQIQSAGRFIEHQQLLAADIAHHNRKALHLPAGKRQGMPFLIRQQIHLF